MGMAILQNELAATPWETPAGRRLPGLQPMDFADWLRVDEAYAGQMAQRDRLIRSCPEAVHALTPQAQDAADELYSMALTHLPSCPGFRVGADEVLRPDGVTVTLDRARPLMTLGRLVAEDLCLMQKPGNEHVLTGAILCFPSHWTLSEKIGHPMTRIHQPVEGYDDQVARRVQRIFDNLRVDQPVWRGNLMRVAKADLFSPRRETDAPYHCDDTAPFLRSERQSLMRLPKTKAIVFTIHTSIIRRP